MGIQQVQMLEGKNMVLEYLKELNKITFAGNRWEFADEKELKKLNEFNIFHIFENIHEFGDKFSFKVLLEVQKSWKFFSIDDLKTILNSLSNAQAIMSFISFLTFVVEVDGLRFFNEHWNGNKELKIKVLELLNRNKNQVLMRDYFRKEYEVHHMHFLELKKIIEKGHNE